MNYPTNMSRRYSVLTVPNGGSNTVRPRSSSTSVIGISENSADFWRSSATPCFVSPRMAFTTQLSHDSPIQIVTCDGSSVVQPPSKWKCRCHLSSLSRTWKATLLILVLIFSTALYLLLKEHSTHQSDQCGDLHTNAHCHDGHGFTSPLQVFLRNSTKRLAATSQQTNFPETSADTNNDHEERSYKPRMLTVQGQYKERNDLANVGHNSIARVSSTLLEGDITPQNETTPTDNEELQPIMEGLARAEKDIMDESRYKAEGNAVNKQPPVNVLEEAARTPAPQHTHNWQDRSHPEDRSQEFMHEKALPGDHGTLSQLYMQQRILEQNNYHSEQKIVKREIEHQHMLRRRQQEELWQEQKRQPYYMQQDVPPHPHNGMSEVWVDQGEMGRPSRVSAHHREEFDIMDRRHPAWRDPRLPRGVHPRRYYMHTDL